MEKNLLLKALDKARGITPKSKRTAPDIRRCALYFRDSGRACILAYSEGRHAENDVYPVVSEFIDVGPDAGTDGCYAFIPGEACASVKASEHTDLEIQADRTYDVRTCDDHKSGRSMLSYDWQGVAELAQCANVLYLAACLGPVLAARALPLVGIAAQPLRALLAGVLHSASLDETRSHLNTVFLERLSDTEARAVSTDGHRLTRLDADVQGLPVLETESDYLRTVSSGAPLPLLGVKALLDRTGKKTVEARIALQPQTYTKYEVVTEHFVRSSKSRYGDGRTVKRVEIKEVQNPQHFIANVGGSTILMRTDGLVFPPYDQVIPRTFTKKAKVDRKVLLDVVKALDFTSKSQHYASLVLRLDVNRLHLTGDYNNDNNEYKSVSMDVTASCGAYGNFKIGINTKYLRQALEASTDKEVNIGCNGELDPIRLDFARSVAVIMPTRT